MDGAAEVGVFTGAVLGAAVVVGVAGAMLGAAAVVGVAGTAGGGVGAAAVGGDTLTGVVMGVGDAGAGSPLQPATSAAANSANPMVYIA